MTLDPAEWRAKPTILCPASRPEPDVCDCGYEGPWHMRFWTHLQPCPPTYASIGPDGTKELHRRCASCKNGGTGHDLIAGWEERCPSCGDIERFTMDGELVAAIRNPDGPGYFLPELPFEQPTGEPQPEGPTSLHAKNASSCPRCLLLHALESDTRRSEASGVARDHTTVAAARAAAARVPCSCPGPAGDR